MPRIEVDKDRCKGCGLCVKACPCGAIELSDQFNALGYYPCKLIYPEKCKGCTFCALVCPDMAIEVFKEEK